MYSDEFITGDVHESLRKPAFDNWQWDDAEMIILLRYMFVDLDLVDKCHLDVRIKLSTESRFSWPNGCWLVYQVTPYFLNWS